MPAERRVPTVVMSSSRKEAVRLAEENRLITDGGHVPLPEAVAVNGRGLPESVFRPRKRLCVKAKQEPELWFHTVCDQIWRPGVLAAAWAPVIANDGHRGWTGLDV